MGVSLWLMPSPEETKFLRSFMQEHPPPSEGTSSFPPFDPHVTLVSVPSSNGVPTVLRGSIPTEQCVMTARLSAVIASDHYFRSVITTVQLTPELENFRNHVADYISKEANIEAKSPMFPHLSIHYIDEPDATLRESIVTDLYSSKRVVEYEQGVRLTSSLGSDDGISQITIQEIWVVECEGPVEGWKVLDKIILKRS